MSQRKKKETSAIWVILPVIVAVVSLLLNIYQYYDGREKQRIDEEIAAVDLKMKQHAAGVNLKDRYYVGGGEALLDLTNEEDKDTRARMRVVQNEVYKELSSWLGRDENWNGVIAGDDINMQSHGIVLLEISNDGTVDADQVVLVVRYKDFPAAGVSDAELWDLDPAAWETTEISLRDLGPKDQIFFPLAHVLGTSHYFDRVFLPVSVKWRNPISGITESKQIDKMRPEDQWIAGSLQFYQQAE